MKNKGFTLVELLAVIVVLSIIALIGYSAVGNVISSTQDSSNKITMKNYAKAVDQAVFLYEMNNEDSDVPELNSTWLKENVKFEKATVECEYATYNKTSSLYGCTVNNSDKTYCYTGATAVECTPKGISKIYGESIQNGTPTPTSPVEIESVGEKTKNLFDYDNTPIFGGATKQNNGYRTSIGFENIRFYTYQALTNYIGKTVTISFNLTTTEDGEFNIFQYQNNGIGIRFTSVTKKMSANTAIKIILTGKVEELGTNEEYSKGEIIVYKSGYTGTYFINNIQFELGETATSYEPYGYKIPITVSNGTETKTTNIYLKEPLRKVGEYADYLDLTNKKVVRNVKEKILSSSDKLFITGRGISFTENVDIIKPSSTLTLPLVMCSHYNKSEWTYTMPTAGTKEGVSINSTARLIGFYDSVNTTSLEKFKAFLDSNEVKLNYLLVTPTEENIDVPEIPSLTGNVTYSIGTSIKPNKLEYGY